ncbi:MAG: RagB/SusD family nutrient uptake outer membrane protein [Bacteroidales bacterium]|nr:RagB/SusD family nutrient uptake outer membrane protein [Bacteroidales bacterium]
MNKIYILAIAVLIFIMSGCSKDYLETTPTGSISPSTLFKTTENAAIAVNGLNKLMNRQLIGSQGYNGEGTIKLYFGDYPGQTMSVALTGWNNTINGEYHASDTDRRTYYAWYYYYMLIGNANTIIEEIDDAEGPEAERQFIKAQALSYRAFSYMNLIQLYSVRWIDSNNGSAPGVVLRLDTSTGDMPLSTQAEVYDQIYKDLDDAIDLFTKSGIERDEEWMMGLDVAYAIYARAAITKQDYAKALSMAKKARANYPLMSVAEYKAGFCNPTKEWIWYLYNTDTETLYYYSYFAYVGYNAVASQVRNYPKCISRELFNKIPETDIRRGLFLDPKGMSYSTVNGFATKGKALDKYGRQYASEDGRKGIESNFKVFAYMQFKIATEGQPGIGNLSLFRSSEMVLIEAEANYFLNNIGDAQKNLVELNKTSKRDPEYNCVSTGVDLLNEIKFYREVELWGEGFNWFDLKRWGDSIVRRSFKDGGNFLSAVAVTIGPHEKNEWTWVIPKKETDYNKEIR